MCAAALKLAQTKLQARKRVTKALKKQVAALQALATEQRKSARVQARLSQLESKLGICPSLILLLTRIGY